MSEYQTAYKNAQQKLKDAIFEIHMIERDYIKKNGVKNKDGMIPGTFDELDTENAHHVALFYTDMRNGEIDNLIKNRDKAEKELKNAEDVLISWGLSTKPESERNILIKGLGMSHVYRVNIIQQFLEQ
jgi:hypothetical protein